MMRLFCLLFITASHTAHVHYVSFISRSLVVIIIYITFFNSLPSILFLT